MATTIQVPEKLKARLDRLKQHPRQPYAEVIAEAIDRMEEDELPLSAETKRAIAAGRRDVARGRTKSLAEVRRELGL